MKKNKSITLVSNNYWTLYKFRYDVVNLFIKKGYIVNLIGKKDGFQKKFTNKSINKYYIPISERGINIFNEIYSLIHFFAINPNVTYPEKMYSYRNKFIYFFV